MSFVVVVVELPRAMGPQFRGDNAFIDASQIHAETIVHYSVDVILVEFIGKKSDVVHVKLQQILALGLLEREDRRGDGFHLDGDSSPGYIVELVLIVFVPFTLFVLHCVLDAADYGVPQHRERVFCIGFLDEAGDGKSDFLFPAPIKLEKKERDYLDDKTPGVVRELTARERIRLMGFPDTFKQVVSDAQFSKQAGNSIVVQCMEALFRQMDISQYGVEA